MYSRFGDIINILADRNGTLNLLIDMKTNHVPFDRATLRLSAH